MAASPNDSEILKHASDFAATVGRMNESRALVVRAAEIDPMNPVLASNAAVALADIGQIEDAYREFDRILMRWPDFPWARTAPLLIASMRGDFDVAERFLMPSEGASQTDRVALRTFDLMRRPREDARAMLLESAERQFAKNGLVELGLLANMYNIGLHDEAFALIERASFGLERGNRPGNVVMNSLIFGATNEAMRGDPRFVLLCDRLGLTAYWTATGRWPDCADEIDDYDFREEANKRTAAHA